MASAPKKHGFASDPVLGIVSHLGIHGLFLTILRYYVGVLAGTILIIGTNAGIMGSSRISYAMSSYRQIPEFFRRLHPRLRTPWRSLFFFSATFPILLMLPGLTLHDREVNFLGTMYSFGAMLSFAIANISLIALRYRYRDAELAYKARPNFRFRGVDWPIFAIVGLFGTAAAWFSITIQESEHADRRLRLADRPDSRSSSSTASASCKIPLRHTTHAPAEILPWQLEYRQILVPVFAEADVATAMNVACQLAAERRSRITVVAPLEVPLGISDRRRVCPRRRSASTTCSTRPRRSRPTTASASARDSFAPAAPPRRSSPRRATTTPRSSCCRPAGPRSGARAGACRSTARPSWC